MSVATYSARMDATLDSGISRWMWLVKWLIAIPHYIVLRVAAYAGLMTDKYPPFKLDMAGPRAGRHDDGRAATRRAGWPDRRPSRDATVSGTGAWV